MKEPMYIEIDGGEYSGNVGVLLSSDSRRTPRYEVRLKHNDAVVRVSMFMYIQKDVYDTWTPPKPVDTTKPKPAKRGGKK